MEKINESLIIGIGTGVGQQFLIVDRANHLWVVDHATEQAVKLSNPKGLMEVLQEQLSR